MTGWVEGTISSLRCETNDHVTAHLIFSADTDMVTNNLAALTSVSTDEIVVAEMRDEEITGDGDAFQSRINHALGRDDLRTVTLLRVETDTPPTGLSFQQFRREHTPPRIVFACPICGSDAVACDVETLGAFNRHGKLTILADLDVRDRIQRHNGPR